MHRNNFLIKIYHIDDESFRAQFVGNEVKGRISKWLLQQNKSSPNFLINGHFLLSGVHIRDKCSLFGKFGMLCFLVTPVKRF